MIEIPVWVFVILCALALPLALIILFICLVLIYGIVYCIIVKLIKGIKNLIERVRVWTYDSIRNFNSIK